MLQVHQDINGLDLMNQTPDQIPLTKSLVAELKLNQLIEDVKKTNNLPSNKISLGGFSQGWHDFFAKKQVLKEKIK